MTPLRLANSAVIGDQLALAWEGGGETILSFEQLRKACPCAHCQGEPAVTGKVILPKVVYGDRSFQMTGFELVGGYALQPTWGDGHRTGLYSFSYLRSLDPEEETG